MKKRKKISFSFCMFVGVLPARTPVHQLCEVPTEARSVHQLPWDSNCNCELSCGCLELNQGPLEERSVPLTTEPSLQSWTNTDNIKN